MQHPIEILFKVNKDCIMDILQENLDRPQKIQKIKSIQKGLNDSINEFLFTMQNNHDKLTDYEIVICDSCGKEFNDRDILIESYTFADIEVSPCCSGSFVYK